MTPDLIFPLVLIGALGFFCLVALVFGVFVVIFISRIANFGRLQTADLAVPSAEEFLARAELRPWEPGAWADLSCRWEGWWQDVTRVGRYEGYTQGIVKSLQAPAGPGWMAYTIQRLHRQSLQQQSKSGHVILKTSEQRIELWVTGRSAGDRNVQVETTINGAAAGSITVTYPNCLYRSTDGALEAQWISEVRAKGSWGFTGEYTREVAYDPLTVNGRPVAALTDTWIRRPNPNSRKPIPPALQSVPANLTPDEQRVLLIALGMGLYRDSLRTRQTRHDW